MEHEFVLFALLIINGFIAGWAVGRYQAAHEIYEEQRRVLEEWRKQGKLKD